MKFLADGSSSFLDNYSIAAHRLPAHYSEFERIFAENFSAEVCLPINKNIREILNKLPILTTDYLSSNYDYERAYLILSFFGQAYVWGNGTSDSPSETIAANISVPWCYISHKLGLVPIISYAAVELYNFSKVDPQGFVCLDNFKLHYNFTKDRSESWFYLISLGIEAHGVPIVPHLIAALSPSSPLELANHLNLLAKEIALISPTLDRMYEECDPDFFYDKVRPYQTGWENSKEFPNGVYYEGVKDAKNPIEPRLDNIGEFAGDIGSWQSYAGGSAGQSPIIHFIDIALGVSHYTTQSSGSEPVSEPPKKKSVYIHEMRKYMKREHREFLNNLEANHHTIRQTVENIQSDINIIQNEREEVLKGFNLCVDAVKTFRDRHLVMITRYIIKPAKQRQKALAHRVEIEEIIKEEAETDERVFFTDDEINDVENKVRQKTVVRGTGGTDLIPFLKQMRDETIKAKV